MSEAREQERAAGTSGAENPQRDGQGRFAAGNRGGPGNPCRIFDEEKDEDEEEEEEEEEEVHGGGSEPARARNDKPPSSGDEELAAALAGFDRETELLKAVLGIPPEEREKEGGGQERQTAIEALRRPKANGVFGKEKGGMMNDE